MLNSWLDIICEIRYNYNIFFSQRSVKMKLVLIEYWYQILEIVFVDVGWHLKSVICTTLIDYKCFKGHIPNFVFIFYGNESLQWRMICDVWNINCILLNLLIVLFGPILFYSSFLYFITESFWLRIYWNSEDDIFYHKNRKTKEATHLSVNDRITFPLV